MASGYRGDPALTSLAPTRQTVASFFDALTRDGIVRIEGTAVFLSRSRTDTPPLLAWHVRQNRCLYSDVIMMTVATSLVPRVASGERFDIAEERPRVWRVIVHCGFLEHVDFEGLLPALKTSGCEIDMTKVVFYVAHETIIRAARNKRLLPSWQERLFAAMERNQAHLVDVLELPSDRVVEIGRHVEL